MKKHIQYIRYAVILLTLLFILSSCQAPEQGKEPSASAPSQPAKTETAPTTTPTISPTTTTSEVKKEEPKPVVNVEPLIKDDAPGDAAFNIYIKDQPGTVRYLETYVTKVEVTKASGEKFLLFEGKQKIRLDDETTTRIGRGKVQSGGYSEVRIGLDDEATIRFKDGTEAKAKVINSIDIKARLDYALKKAQTVSIIVDLPLKGSIRQEEEDGKAFYIFEPPVSNFASIGNYQEGIYLKDGLGYISYEDEKRIGVQHNMGDVDIVIPPKSLTR